MYMVLRFIAVTVKQSLHPSGIIDLNETSYRTTYLQRITLPEEKKEHLTYCQVSQFVTCTRLTFFYMVKSNGR